MTCDKCNYVRQENEITSFKCSICHDIHLCGPGICDSTAYNTDYTNICTKTGLCFEQKVCDSMVDTNRGVTNTLDQKYFHKIKRDQQIKNSILDRCFVDSLFSELNFYRKLNPNKRIDLLNQILALWKEFIVEANRKNIYVHRKDKRCFLVAIMFGMRTGISCSTGYVVFPHDEIELNKLNKKKNYRKFFVSDVRLGCKLIMGIFKNHEVLSPIRL